MIADASDSVDIARLTNVGVTMRDMQIFNVRSKTNN